MVTRWYGDSGPIFCNLFFLLGLSRLKKNQMVSEHATRRKSSTIVLMNLRKNKFSHFIFFSGTSLDKSFPWNTSGLWQRRFVSMLRCLIHLMLQLQLNGFPSSWSSSNWLKIAASVESSVLKLQPRRLRVLSSTSKFSSSIAFSPKTCGWIAERFFDPSNANCWSFGNP